MLRLKLNHISKRDPSSHFWHQYVVSNFPYYSNCARRSTVHIDTIVSTVAMELPGVPPGRKSFHVILSCWQLISILSARTLIYGLLGFPSNIVHSRYLTVIFLRSTHSSHTEAGNWSHTNILPFIYDIVCSIIFYWFNYIGSQFCQFTYSFVMWIPC